MKKITIRQLKTGWRLTLGRGARKRREAYILYNLVERRLSSFLASSERGKTAVRVVYGDNGHNESLSSGDERYLLYTLGCFLEDHLSGKIMLRIERNYL